MKRSNKIICFGINLCPYMAKYGECSKQCSLYKQFRKTWLTEEPNICSSSAKVTPFSPQEEN